LDARSGNSYVKSHIPGAIHADLFHYFVPGTDRKGLRKFHEDLGQRLGNLGLTGKETIVIYESGFGMRAARVGWMLEYAGAHKVRNSKRSEAERTEQQSIESGCYFLSARSSSRGRILCSSINGIWKGQELCWFMARMVCSKESSRGEMRLLILGR